MVTVASESAKAAIVARQVRTKLPSHKLSKQFGVGARIVRKIVKNSKDGVYNYGANGRPPSLDAQSQDRVKLYLQHIARQMSPLENKELLAIIKWEAWQTFMRRHPNYVRKDRRRKNCICYKSLKNYQQKFTLFYTNI
jgi:hypothetical protein